MDNWEINPTAFSLGKQNLLPTTSGNLAPQYPPPPTNPSSFSSFPPAYHDHAVINPQVDLLSFPANPKTQRWADLSTSAVTDDWAINPTAFSLGKQDLLPTTSGNLAPQYSPPPTNPSLFSSFPAYHSCAIIDSQINLSSFSLANPESQRWVNSSTSTVIDPLINSSSFFPNPKPQLVAKPRVSPDCLYIMIR